MCGRATLVTPPEVIAELFGLDEVPDLEPRFNIAPSQTIAIVRRDPARPGRHLELAEWGLAGAGIAAGSARASARAPSRIVNVRVESMFTRAAFREAAAARRCLVVVDGFYEWRAATRAPSRSGACGTGASPRTAARGRPSSRARS